eukprot:CAMPEP_0206241376 /NCGR_PEP_ID=MMETSP0047_2-20121206/16459_1 /ASSEMBLY_ACC=CAM_ASM_000192 /TAXON_ID=195065 /ORGANISM="Chroomonas mesostigmatica_cf, Strain CCMP1168" /LENGTH=350 /DNA_ID=CAMNT_0053666261 /DNA_START=51 /DNA_END=1103 /DNA_ORIENTATION=+
MLCLIPTLAFSGTLHQPLPRRFATAQATARAHGPSAPYLATLRMSGGGDKPKPTFGFLGMGIMGVPMCLNLLKAGFDVTVWNRDGSKCDAPVKAGAKQAASPAEVVRACDITFAMLSDPAAAQAVAMGQGCEGVVEAITAEKGYVDCSTVDAGTSKEISDAVRAKGGYFLEAPVSGSKKPAEDAQLIFLCAGDERLYRVVSPALESMGKKHKFLGEVGAGAKMKLVVNMVMSTMLAAFSEGIVLTEFAGLKVEDFFDVVDNSAIAAPMFKVKSKSMKERDYPPAFPLKHAQKDLRLALELSQDLSVQLPVAATAQASFTQALRVGLGDRDFSAVHDVISHGQGESGETSV